MAQKQDQLVVNEAMPGESKILAEEKLNEELKAEALLKRIQKEKAKTL